MQRPTASLSATGRAPELCIVCLWEEEEVRSRGGFDYVCTNPGLQENGVEVAGIAQAEDPEPPNGRALTKNYKGPNPEKSSEIQTGGRVGLREAEPP